jgi:hypothetical protein
VNRRFLTNGLIECLETRTGKKCGDHEAPVTEDKTYMILYALPGGDVGGPPLVAPEADVTVVYQITSVGEERANAEWMADRARQAIMGRYEDGRFKSEISTPSGYVVADRRQLPDGGVDREGKAPNVVYSVPNRYALVLTPG